MDVYLNGKKIPLHPSKAIGKGGEADVYDLGNGKALKLFKPPNHPDYQGNLMEQQAARDRLAERQRKLPQFPQNLPSYVIRPESLATDKKRQTILGYTMPLIQGAATLMKYSDRAFRQAGITNQSVVAIFQQLHNIVEQIHQAQVVLGDFNDLNVLIKSNQPYLIDADSFQYGGFLSKVFTARFVDPLLCDPDGDRPLLNQPHSVNSDWYAFTVMLMQSLLFVDPYGGVYRPKDPTKRIAHDARPLHRITVFHPEVKYPKPAVPYQVLPDNLLHYFHQIFEQDRRGKFERSLLDNLQWQTCQTCGIEYARNTCPNCTTITTTLPQLSATLTVIVRGTVTANRIFATEGIILFASLQNQKIQWLYHQSGEFRREDNFVVLSGNLDPELQFRIKGKTTLIAIQGQIFSLIPYQNSERLAIDSFDVNEYGRYWTYSGQLLRDGNLGAEYIGDVLAGQTHFWVGNNFGFGFYRAGNLNVAFVFDTNRRGINDTVKIPFSPGQLIDATCTFADERCWFFWATQEAGRIINRCTIIRSNGTIEATAEAERGDNSWLASLGGKCAAGKFLLAATDDGVVRVELQNGQIVKTKEFPDTEPFVNASSQLLASEQGLYVINQRQINLLKIA